MLSRMYDSIIIGGGPAGLSAAIYLARFNRNVLVIDQQKGRSTYPQINENYLGFPSGIKAKELRSRGIQQAKRFGVHFAIDTIKEIKKKTNFIAIGNQKYQGRTLIFATGVTDILPDFKNVQSYVGKSLFWCITCDGYKMRGKKIVIIGKTDEAAITAMQFLQFTKDITIITNCDKSSCEVSEKVSGNLKKYKITMHFGVITHVLGQNGMVSTIFLSSGDEIITEYMFNLQGAIPNSTLAKQLGVTTKQKGYIIVGDEQRTNIPFVYAAGDITKHFSHQIVTAAHEGSMAAQAANYDLYASWQKE